MADATDLFKAMNTSALIDAAKYGGYSPIDMNTLTAQKKGRGFGGLLDIILPMYAAATNAPAAKMLMAGRQAYNLHQYNKQSQQQALYALQQEKLGQASDADVAERRTGYRPQGNFNRTFFDQSAGDMRNDANLDFNQERLRSGVVDPSLIRFNTSDVNSTINDAMKRAGEINDAGATMNRLGQYMLTPTGQDPTRLMQSMQSQGMAPPPLQQGLASLQGAITKTQPVYPADAFTMGIPNISQLLTGRHNEQGQIETNKHNRTTEAETSKHNRATEGIGWYNAKTGRINANKPRGGGGFSLDAAMWSSMTPEQRQEWIARRASGASGPPVDYEGKRLNEDLNQAVKAFGKNSKEAKAAYQAIQTHQTLNPGSAAAGLLSNPLDQIGNVTPFGGTSTNRLNKAGKTVGAQYGVKY